MLLCLGMFVFELWQDPGRVLLGRWTQIEFQFGFIGFLVPYEPWRVLTGPFLHAAPWHLFNNVFFLLLLGSWLEEDIGAVRWIAHEAVGCVLIDGYAFGIPATGHPVKTIARRLEAIRLALAGPAATAPDSPG